MELAMIEDRVTVPAEPPAPLASTSFTSSTYDSFVAEHRPRLLQVLVARFGIEVGADATADAMAYSFEHWDRIEPMTNPLGYLFRVGQTSARKQFRWSRSFALPEPEPSRLPDVEPGLARALMKLDHEQRVMVMLVHGHDWSYAEVAAVFDVTVTKVRNELFSAMQKLRKQLGGADSASGSKSAREQAAKPETKQAVEQERGARS
jgi:DNA-directed RNA polymerase specialized sigma24 family protein